MKIILAGTYPMGTAEAIARAFAGEDIQIASVLSQDALDAVEEADAVVLRVLKMSKKTIAHIRGLRAILRWGAGYDSVDVEAAGQQGVFVCNTPGANACAVAQLTVLLMLAVGRNLMGNCLALKAGIWRRDTNLKLSSTLHGKTVGLIGGGNIGRLVAKQVQAFGARVQYCDVFPMDAEQERELGMQRVPLETLLKTSDIVSLHIPLTPQNKNLIDAKAIASMKEGAILINASRGGLVDEAALLEAVQSGHLSGAGIDCPSEEPVHSENPLLTEEKIIVTPHMGGATRDVSDFVLPMLLENLQALHDGAPLRYVVNRGCLERSALS